MRSWLSKFPFAMIVLAMVLLWNTYRALKGLDADVPEWRIGLYLLAAGMALVLAFMGLRERHRHQ